MKVKTITPSNLTVMSPALAALYTDARKYPIMTPEEEVAVFSEYASANDDRKQEIKEQVVNSNLRFIISAAKRYSSDGDTIAELVAEGIDGAYKAVEAFNLKRGYRFISYAVHWVCSSMSTYMLNYGAIAYRSNSGLIGSKDEKIRERILQETEREATDEEVIEALEKEYGIKIKNSLDITRARALSMDATVDDDSEATVAECGDVALRTASHNTCIDNSEREAAAYSVNILLSKLSDRDREVVKMSFGIGYDEAMDNDKIAAELGCTSERIRQIIRDAKKMMKQHVAAIAM